MNTETAPAPASTQEIVDLPQGRALDVDQAGLITCAASTHVLVLLGDAASGKTTLVAGLFHHFQTAGPFAGYLFAGSDTLPALDERCHLARIASGRRTADTLHSSRLVGPRCVHLRIRRMDCNGPVRELLLLDIPGEMLKDALDSEEDARRLPAVRRADHVVVLIDGEKLADREQRASGRRSPAAYLDTFLATDSLGPHSLVDVLLNKWDLLKEDKGMVQLAEDIEGELRRQFAGRLGRLRFQRVAARPHGGALRGVYGLDQLFPSWVEERGHRFRPEPVRFQEPDGTSEFDRYLRHRLPDLFD